MRFVTRMKLIACCTGSALAFAAPSAGAQQVVASFTAGTESATFVPGQSFTVAGTGTFTNLTFNFYDAAVAPFATGTLYLFLQPYTGTPAALASSSARRATAVNNAWSFGSSFSFVAGSQFYVYADTAFANSGSSVGGYAGGNLYTATTTADNFLPAGLQDTNFRATATAVAGAVPEPASWALMIAGFGAIGLVTRRQRARISFAGA